ncbi:SAM-dependent methyltransferase [Saccharothrix coeruleofusca]|uniref:50S ribosomal protein L11 methyltransferase n=1 Tax=Saccharothrix coeruleofusca TaxID=33919 RepID=UPI001AE49CCA|nr:50S ribosomal protein L11 methyltransferase [Saccharothrix coeruleofusca]MBP2336052.1 SAM-dependent methyltransferase [Saccharothrix coeruleofusca]
MKLPWAPEDLPNAAADRFGSLKPALREAGFSDDVVARRLGAADAIDLLSHSAMYAVYSALDVESLTTDTAGALIQLFVRNGPLPRDRYEHVVSAPLARVLEALALVRIDEGQVSPTVSISPVRSLYLLSDALFTTGPGDVAITMATGAGLVMPPHASSFTLLDAIRTTASETLLDIGCGSGILALASWTSCASVIGIDVNPRAVAYSRVNAAVNAIPAAFTVADMNRNPLPAERADRLVFNSPTGPRRSPETGWTSAQGALRSVVRAMGTVLVPGGTADVLVIAELPQGRALPDLVDEWLADLRGWKEVRVREVPGSPQAVSARDLASGRLSPKCLLADGPEDRARLLHSLRVRGIESVVPAVVSITSV